VSFPRLPTALTSCLLLVAGCGAGASGSRFDAPPGDGPDALLDAGAAAAFPGVYDCQRVFFRTADCYSLFPGLTCNYELDLDAAGGAVVRTAPGPFGCDVGGFTCTGIWGHGGAVPNSCRAPEPGDWFACSTADADPQCAYAFVVERGDGGTLAAGDKCAGIYALCHPRSP
jgi:hypothetical protein